MKTIIVNEKNIAQIAGRMRKFFGPHNMANTVVYWHNYDCGWKVSPYGGVRARVFPDKDRGKVTVRDNRKITHRLGIHITKDSGGWFIPTGARVRFENNRFIMQYWWNDAYMYTVFALVDGRNIPVK